MNPRKKQREELKLSQADAANLAEVSLATWRKWEDNPDKVGQASRESCEQALDGAAHARAQLVAELDEFAENWKTCPYLTARQAFAVSVILDVWSEMIDDWLEDPSSEPLHEVAPFKMLDLRVMMLVNENRAWAAAALERCCSVSEELRQGVLPFDHPDCFFDEALMALVLPQAEMLMTDMPDIVEGLPDRVSADDDTWVLDDSWERVVHALNDRCHWDDWLLPAAVGNPLLRTMLDERHPFTWFDLDESSYSEHMEQLEEPF